MTDSHLSAEHRDLLLASAITDELLTDRIRSTEDGIEFDWVSVDGRIVTQTRPDEPGDGPKYLFPAGSENLLDVPAGQELGVADDRLGLVIVEGTKQHLAAASHVDSTRFAVVGMAGCYGWSKGERQPVDCLRKIPLASRTVYLALDADRRSNRAVWDAAHYLADHLRLEFGVAEVRFVTLPGGTTDGMDDFLARQDDPAAALKTLLDCADTKEGRAPARRVARDFFDPTGNFRPLSLVRYIDEANPLALTQEQTIAVYQDGRYHNGSSRKFNAIVLDLLGDDFTPLRLHTAEQAALALCAGRDARIPENLDEPIVNVKNGLLDLRTLELRPHDPSVRTMKQIDVEWDPAATCPIYEAWLDDLLPGQADEIEQVAATMLDETRTPRKALFLYGPSRSGKSTYLRILRAMVGPRDTSSVTLHALSDDTFASANVYGKRLNIAADISSREVADLSAFKMLTGEDHINANKKYGAQFSFRNSALFAFSANEIPAVSEGSDAYFQRVIPFNFAKSFKGNEDPTVEARILAELPGILARFARAAQAFICGGYRYTVNTTPAAEEFRRRSDRVLDFILTCTEPSERPVGTLRSELYGRFKLWAEDQGGKPMGRNKFFDRVRNCGVDEFKPQGGSWTFEVVWNDPEKGDSGGSDGSSSALVATFGNYLPLLPRGMTTNIVDSTNPQGSEEELPKEPKPLCNKGESCRENCRSSAERKCRRPDPLVFDLETASADLLHAPRSATFTRIVGTSGGYVGPDHSAVLDHPGPLVAHNGFCFDFIALRRLGFDLLAASEADRLIDTKILGILADPPPGGMGSGEQIRRAYSLNKLAERLGAPLKVDEIKRLAKVHGGFDRIPLDDPEYLTYCAGDVATTVEVFERLGGAEGMNDYARREMRLMGRLTASISCEGFRVDTGLLAARLAAGRSVVDDGKAWLVERYGLPTTRKDGAESANPLATAAGVSAVDAAFADLGIVLPRTEKGSRASVSRSTMDAIIAQSDSSAAVELARVVKGIVGNRTIYQTISDRLVGDRVHPQVFPGQASGRLSITDPGLTVFGKRGGKVTERAIMLPDDGHVLIAADLNQIDARAIAAHAQDEAYLELFTGGRDSHAEIAAMVWGDRSRREEAKAIGHGWNYGMGLARLADQAGVSIDVATEFDATMRSSFPRLVQWRDEIRETARAGVLLDNGFGRKLRAEPERAHTQAPALMGQATARDLMAEGVLRLPVDVVPMIRAFVHDEIVLSVPISDVDAVERDVMAALEFSWRPPGATHAVEITAGLSKRGANWADVYRKND